MRTTIGKENKLPQRSKIITLPDNVKAELESRLIKGSFTGYKGLAAWLATEGYEISHSSIHRYGQKFEEKIQAVKAASDMAVALVDNVGDDAGKMNDAIVRMYQEKLFKVFVEMKDIDAENINFVKLGRAIADVTRSSVSQKKWMSVVRNKAKTAADEVVKVAKKGGLSQAMAEDIRKKVLGIGQ
jgi:hypothetical protein